MSKRIPAPKRWELPASFPSGTVMGWDLSTRRSAAAFITPDYKVRPFIRWTKAPRSVDINQYLPWYKENVLAWMDALPTGLTIAMDWSLHESKIRTAHQTSTMLKSFIAGFTYDYLESKGHHPIFISPGLVRKLLKGKSNATKPEVHNTFKALTGIDVNAYDTHMDDAIILGWAVHQIQFSPVRNEVAL